MTELVFLKLGGSLITDKDKPFTPRLDKLAELAGGIASSWNSERRLILGHGSGSFGHAAANKYGTRQGFASETWGKNYWKGFAEVWFQASKLNRFVMEALRAVGLPAIALAPVAAVTSREIRVKAWDLTPLCASLDAGLLPVIYGDVIFDEARRGTILSTEDLFAHLARQLHPQRILLAGLEEGVWEDFPARTRLVDRLNLQSYERMRAGIGASASVDVTGGMADKVGQMFDLVRVVPGLTVRIFSAREPGNLERAIAGEGVGTELGA
jgi:isopentenyl phosphate kinase